MPVKNMPGFTFLTSFLVILTIPAIKLLRKHQSSSEQAVENGAMDAGKQR